LFGMRVLLPRLLLRWALLFGPGLRRRMLLSRRSLLLRRRSFLLRSLLMLWHRLLRGRSLLLRRRPFLRRLLVVWNRLCLLYWSSSRARALLRS
jgi:hypothetical protein